MPAGGSGGDAVRHTLYLYADDDDDDGERRRLVDYVAGEKVEIPGHGAVAVDSRERGDRPHYDRRLFLRRQRKHAGDAVVDRSAPG